MPPYSTATHSSIMTAYCTFFYHAHIKLLDLHFVYGALVVKAPSATDPYAAYEDRVLMLSDYWASDVETLHAGLAFLTNGKTIAGNCMAPDTATFVSLGVQQGQYLVRLTGATSLFVVHFFRIPQHKLTLVEVEDTYVTPKEHDYIKVLPAQRLSFVVTADQPSVVPSAVAAPLVLNETQVAWGVNGSVYEHYHHTTLLEDVIASTVWSRPVGARPIAYFTTGQVVGIVLQNNVALNGVCEVHP
ncbi:hypothetical protein DYB38_007907 [Aphanomyces astaci]|uniref:Plastocyanin-like domain-containing protein n=1 Tax=Aphanomyces astaci TaxID=112090 RepID=A0A397AJI5_APHAT|nr:hypothetical protein DYB36_004206 [Aphanomyces astaci]RHY66714.1 hypothetical protein DYB34_008013 [Aphanomyces astaci]RHY76170.1 hypothetical protein DYB38_007907 [Aphanomyces astaci]